MTDWLIDWDLTALLTPWSYIIPLKYRAGGMQKQFFQEVWLLWETCTYSQLAQAEASIGPVLNRIDTAVWVYHHRAVVWAVQFRVCWSHCASRQQRWPYILDDKYRLGVSRPVKSHSYWRHLTTVLLALLRWQLPRKQSKCVADYQC